MVAVSSWGRLSNDQHDVVMLSHQLPVAGQIQRTPGGIAHGLGKSYGDLALNANGLLWKTTSLDRLISFDHDTGLLVCESGVVLKTIQDIFIPRGWSLAVVPGTQLITVGGAIANDVHGKNHHHQGTFGDHITRIYLCRTDGSTIECGPDLEAAWFYATLGGLGLTGVISHAAIQLRRVPGRWLETESIAYTGLDQFFALSACSESDWEYTVSWFDCTSTKSRGIFCGRIPQITSQKNSTHQENRAYAKSPRSHHL